MILGGYLLGRSIPDVGKKIHYVIAVVVIVSLLPAVISILRERREAKSRDTKNGSAVKPPVIEKA
jgi:membrane-associated protein